MAAQMDCNIHLSTGTRVRYLYIWGIVSCLNMQAAILERLRCLASLKPLRANIFQFEALYLQQSSVVLQTI